MTEVLGPHWLPGLALPSREQGLWSATQSAQASRRQDMALAYVKAWLRQLDPKSALLVEPCCGGGTVSLNAAMEGRANDA